jgi:hypothetical protein
MHLTRRPDEVYGIGNKLYCLNKKSSANAKKLPDVVATSGNVVATSGKLSDTSGNAVATSGKLFDTSGKPSAKATSLVASATAVARTATCPPAAIPLREPISYLFSE